MEVTARCMRHKEPKPMKDIRIEKTSKGGFMVKGLCVECDCKMCKILSKDNAKLISQELNIGLPE